MYPRNAASPERIAIGPVVKISDGAVQTSGVSVSVLPMGASSGAGAGTVAYENGVVVYTPTQAETDYTSVVFVAYKTGCIPACQSIVFSSAAVVGQVDVGKVNGTAQTAGDIVEILTAIKGAGWTTESLKAIKDAVDAIDPLDVTETQAAAAAAIAAAGLAGTGGAYTQTVTVTSDGSTPIPNATVAIYSGSTLVDTKTTNSSGVATPTCDAGSYTLRVTASGYASSSTAITVTADSARAVTLTAISITAPTAAGTATGRLDMHLNDTTAGAYESIYVRQTTRRTATGHGDSKEWRELVANALGVIEAAFFQGLTYEAKRGKDGTPVSFTVSASSDTFYLPSVLGEP